MEPQYSVYFISLTFSKHRHMQYPHYGAVCPQWQNIPYMGNSSDFCLCGNIGYGRNTLAQQEATWEYLQNHSFCDVRRAVGCWEKALCFLWKLSGISLVTPLLFRLGLARLPTTVGMAIRHQRYSFHSCILRSWLLLSNLRGLWVYSQWSWGFGSVFKSFSNSLVRSGLKSQPALQNGTCSSLSHAYCEDLEGMILCDSNCILHLFYIYRGDCSVYQAIETSACCMYIFW